MILQPLLASQVEWLGFIDTGCDPWGSSSL